MYASAIAGLAYDLGTLHVAHALEHAMSALNASITHGEGLGMLLPAVVRELYPAVPEILAELLVPIAPDLRGLPGEAETAAEHLREWLGAIGQSTNMADVDAAAWDALAADLESPFFEAAWLSLLEDSGSAAPSRGWFPNHLLVELDGRLVAGMQLTEMKAAFLRGEA